MILVDIGNSGLRASRVADGGLFANETVYRLSWSAAIASQRKSSPEQESAPNQRWCTSCDRNAYAWLIDRLAPKYGETWRISSVQREVTELLVESIEARAMHANVRIVRHLDLPMTMDVESPDRTGIDRLLAAHAAFLVENGAALKSAKPQLHPVIVVQAGTAVTVDFVDERGVFQGGSIMPGLGLSLQLLAAGTDQLPWLGNHAVDMQPVLPGKNTEQAISAGVNAALVGGTAHLVSRYRHETQGGRPTKVIVSGGDGRLLMQHLPQPTVFVDHLVLRGLCSIV